MYVLLEYLSFVVTGECLIHTKVLNINNTNMYISTENFLDIYAVQQCYETFQNILKWVVVHCDYATFLQNLRSLKVA